MLPNTCISLMLGHSLESSQHKWTDARWRSFPCVGKMLEMKINKWVKSCGFMLHATERWSVYAYCVHARLNNTYNKWERKEAQGRNAQLLKKCASYTPKLLTIARRTDSVRKKKTYADNQGKAHAKGNLHGKEKKRIRTGLAWRHYVSVFPFLKECLKASTHD